MMAMYFFLLRCVDVNCGFFVCRGKLKRLAYSSVQDVILDILLIYDNCVLFNGDDDYYGRYAIRQKKQFVAYLRKQHIDLP